jgi:hypothetical protein
MLFKPLALLCILHQREIVDNNQIKKTPPPYLPRHISDMRIFPDVELHTYLEIDL